MAGYTHLIPKAHFPPPDPNAGFGCVKFMQRTELLRRREELAPEDEITLTCWLRVYKDHNSASLFPLLSQDWLQTFISEKGCDVTLKVKDEEFHVHKLVLSTRSTVFAAMFEDVNGEYTDVLDIMDCDPQAFHYV